MKVQDVSGIYENVENRKMRMPKDMSWAFFLLVSVLLFLWPGLPVAEGTRTVCRAAQVITTDSLQARILDGSLAGQLVDLAEDPFWNETRLQEGEKVLLRLHTSESGLIEDAQVLDYFWAERSLVPAILGAGLLLWLCGGKSRRVLYTAVPGLLCAWRILFPVWMDSAGKAGQQEALGPSLTAALGLSLLLGAAFLLMRSRRTGQFLTALGVYAVSLAAVAAASVILGRILQPGSENLESLFLGAVLVCASGAMAEMILSTFDAIRRSVRWQPGLGMKERASMGILSGRNHMGAVCLMFVISAAALVLVMWMIYSMSGDFLDQMPQGKYLAEEAVNALLLTPMLLLTIPIAAVGGACASIAAEQKKQ